MNHRSRVLRLAALLLVLGGTEARAALPPTLIGASYQLSVPIGETADYTSPVSWRGVGLDTMTWIRPDLAVGLAFGWNVFFNNTTATLHFKGVDISGNQDRTLNVWPTLVNARWFPAISSNRDIRPYIGANIGGYIIERYLGVGLTAFVETHYHFGLAPEIGVLFEQRFGVIFLNARYNMAFAAGGVPFQQFLSFNLGYAWEYGR